MPLLQCHNCQQTFALQRSTQMKLRAASSIKIPFLIHLDRLHKCCTKPDHHWIIDPPDISELVEEALAKEVTTLSL